MASRTLYLGMILVAFLSAQFAFMAHDEAQRLAETTQQALQVATESAMARQDERDAEQLKQEAHDYQHQAHVDHEAAHDNRQKSHYYQELAEHELYFANQIQHNITLLKYLQHELAANITQAAEKMQIPTGVCSYHVIYYICSMIGRTPTLAQRIDEQYELVSDTKALHDTEKLEYMYQQLVHGLEEYADIDQSTAQDYESMAAALDEQSHNETHQAEGDTSRAQQLEADVKTLQNATTDDALQLWKEAETKSQLVFGYGLIAFLMAITTLTFFATSIVQQRLMTMNTLVRTVTMNSALVAFRHVLILLLVLGLNESYLVHWHDYPEAERAVLVIWIAVCTGFLQTSLLGGTAFISCGDWVRPVVTSLILRTTISLLHFLIVCLTLHAYLSTMFHVLGHWKVILGMFAVLVLSYVLQQEPTQLHSTTASATDNDDDDTLLDTKATVSTLPSENDSDSGSPPVIYIHGQHDNDDRWYDELLLTLQVFIVVCNIRTLCMVVPIVWRHVLITMIAIFTLLLSCRRPTRRNDYEELPTAIVV